MNTVYVVFLISRSFVNFIEIKTAKPDYRAVKFEKLKEYEYMSFKMKILKVRNVCVFPLSNKSYKLSANHLV